MLAFASLFLLVAIVAQNVKHWSKCLFTSIPCSHFWWFHFTFFCIFHLTLFLSKTFAFNILLSTYIYIFFSSVFLFLFTLFLFFFFFTRSPVDCFDHKNMKIKMVLKKLHWRRLWFWKKQPIIALFFVILNYHFLNYKLFELIYFHFWSLVAVNCFI